MRSLALAWLGTVFALTGLACTDPIPDGVYACGAGGLCPAGFGCELRPAASERRCYRGAGSDAGDAGESLSPRLEVLVIGEEAGPTTAPDDPFFGATVGFTHPDGTEAEQVTGSDGRAVFDGITWMGEPGRLTVHADGRRVETRIGASPMALGVTGGVLRVRLELAPPTEAVDVSIDDAPADEAEWEITFSRPGAERARRDEDAFAIELPALPLAYASQLWALRAQPRALAGARVRRLLRVVPIDTNYRTPEPDMPIAAFYDEASTTTASGTVEVPSWAVDRVIREGDMELDVFASVLPSEGSLRVGGVTRVEGDQQGIWPYEMLFGRPTFVRDPITIFEIAGEGERSWVVRAGYPSPEPTASEPIDFLAPASVVGAEVSLADGRLEWSLDPRDDEPVDVWIIRLEAGSMPVWDVFVPGPERALVWPSLPPPAREALGEGPWEARVHRCVGRASLRRGVVCERVSASAPVRVIP